MLDKIRHTLLVFLEIWEVWINQLVDDSTDESDKTKVFINAINNIILSLVVSYLDRHI